MLNRLTLSETDTFPEVNTALNKIIDNLNFIEGKVLVLDKTSVKKPMAKSPKKKKGTASMKILLTMVCLVMLLCSVALGEFQQITFDNVTNDNTLVTILRERLSFAGGTFTFANGLTIDNATNNAFTWTENSEDLIWTFSNNAIALSSSTTVTSFDFGTVDPTCDQLTLENAAVISNATDGDVTITEGEDLTLRFSSDNVELLSSTGVLGIDFNDLYIIFAELSAPSNNPADGFGWLYVKDNGGTTDLYFEGDDGVVVELTASASGVANLDEAYDAGGSGTGRTITADSGAVVINNTDNDAAFLLSVTPTPGGSAATGGVQITSGANSSEDSLQIANSGSGFSISTDSDVFTVASDGSVIALDVDITGAGGLILANDETITNNSETEIAFTDSASSEDIIIDLDAGTNAVGWKSGSGVDEWAFGDVDDLTGVGTIVFDVASVSITHTPDTTGQDFTIQQNGTSQNTSIIITTAGTPADALQLTASAGGIDITATSSDAGDDVSILATGTSITLTATENVADSIVLSSSNGGIDILAASAAGGEDIDVIATGSSVNVISTEADAQAIVIDASDAAGGIDMDYGTGGMVLTGTGTAANLTIDVDALSFDFTDSSNITVTSSEAAEDLTISQIGTNDSSIIITSAGDGLNALELTTSDNEGDIDINAGDSITVDANNIILQLTEAAADQFKVDAQGAVAGDAINLETTNGGIMLNADGAVNGDIELNAEGDIVIAGANDITFTLTAAEDTEDFTIAVAGTFDSSLILSSAGTGTDAISLTTSNAAGDIDINAGDAITIDAGDIVITTDDTAQQFHVNAGGTVAGDAIILETTSGAIKFLADGSGTGDITLDAEGLVQIVTAEAAADQFLVTAGGTVAGWGINLTTTNGGILLNADDGTNGDITLDAASVLNFIAAGGITTSDTFTGDGTAALGGFLRTITNDTEPHAVAITESGTVLTNLGANGADTWQLPNAATGLEYIFVVMAAQEMQITPQGADNINSGGTALGAGDYYVADAVGEMLHIIAVDTTNWIVISETGTWTDENP